MAQRLVRIETAPGGERSRLAAGDLARVEVHGKFLTAGGEKLYLYGVTYGTFRPAADGSEFSPSAVERDFAAMAEHGINAVRIYTVPPRWLLDVAERHGLYVLVGLPWEQHVTFLDDPARARAIEERVRAGVRSCAGHSAVLAYAIGNEIPAPVVRWHGARKVERFLRRLYRTAKDEDPRALVTYVNYPSTEYLNLPFLDFVAFNVYLEAQETFEAYLGRLQNVAGDRPLIMAELGLDSRRNGPRQQAVTLDWQLGTSFAAGCAGTFVFAWTDEWHRGGAEVDDWDFGLTDRQRRPKPALAAVQRAYAETPFPRELAWPRVSVIVCSYNGARTIADTCAGLVALDYPDYEVIVVDDGSTDETAAIAASYGFTIIRTENGGLSRARNRGLAAATGEIIAYLDDDARPEPHWLSYLAYTFLSTDFVGVGGPNLAPPGDGPIADCVAHSPGGPIHVLLSDREAEHIPGCNMAFRRENLLAIGGFDPRFRVAGDDVDVCWRLQECGWRIGFHPSAIVWHHRRDSVRTYFRQQRGYGRAEALLERKWPGKYNGIGHLHWAGRLYGYGLTRALHWRRERVLYGTWGTADFQCAHPIQPGVLVSTPLMPEWFLVTVALLFASLVGLAWPPLLLAAPLAALAAMISLLQAGLSAAHAPVGRECRSSGQRLRLKLLTAFLHLTQPVVRLVGRRVDRLPSQPRPRPIIPIGRTFELWSEQWRPRDTWLETAESALQSQRAAHVRGSIYDRWDLAVRSGLLAGARLSMANEEHGHGHQLLRFRYWPRWSLVTWVIAGLAGALGLWSATDSMWVLSTLLLSVVLLVLARATYCTGQAMATIRSALTAMESRPPSGIMPRMPGEERVEHLAAPASTAVLSMSRLHPEEPR
jgi:GT2 family glycosyltransferase